MYPSLKGSDSYIISQEEVLNDAGEGEEYRVGYLSSDTLSLS